jgi:predicted O-methyltransferase YrrM
MTYTEDTWRSPNEWCQNTQYWHAEDDQATEVEVIELVAAFVRALQPEVVVEAGTWTGQATVAMGKALARSKHGRLYAVELDPDLAEEARRACRGLPVQVLTGDSLTWEPPSGIGFAWVDGGRQRGQEVNHLLDHMLPGAVVGIHDTGPIQTPGLRDWLEAQPRLQSITLRTPRGVSFATVT